MTSVLDKLTLETSATESLPELMPLHDKRVCVFGLGRFGGGVAAARFCAAQGAEVLVTDALPAERLTESLTQLQEYPSIRYRLGGHELSDVTRADLIVLNPAVPKDHEFVQAARDQHVPVTSEMNLFFSRCQGKIVGVTGSNGKTTTTRLTAHLLQGSGRRVWVGGNLGVSLLEHVDEIESADAVVLELSSFMLEDLHRLRVSPTVGIVTNLTPNHLDRHGSFDEYVACKLAIFAYQDARGIAVLNGDDLRIRQLQALVPSRLATFSRLTAPRPGAFVRDGQFYVDLGRGPKPVADVRKYQPLGDFNQENALAAILAASVLKTPAAEIAARLPEFSPIEHRLEQCAVADGVTFINDSVSTTPESTIAGLSAFASRVWLIVGGADKGLDYAHWADAVLHSSVVGILAIGAIGQDLIDAAQAANERRPEPRPVFFANCEDLDRVFSTLRRLARPGDVVLFSPATSSFDQFDNFEARGRTFKERAERFLRLATQSRALPRPTELLRAHRAAQQAETGAPLLPLSELQSPNAESVLAVDADADPFAQPVSQGDSAPGTSAPEDGGATEFVSGELPPVDMSRASEPGVASPPPEDLGSAKTILGIPDGLDAAAMTTPLPGELAGGLVDEVRDAEKKPEKPASDVVDWF